MSMSDTEGQGVAVDEYPGGDDDACLRAFSAAVATYVRTGTLPKPEGLLRSFFD